MTEFNLVSPTNERNYTMEDVLKKMKDRAGVYMDKLTFTGFTPMCRYGSRDALLTIENLRVTESLWCDSLNFSISLKVPVHFTRRGKLSFGAGTFDENVHNPYTGCKVEGSISVFVVGGEKETLNIDSKFLSDNNEIIIEMIYIAIATSIFKSECLDEDIEDIEMF